MFEYVIEAIYALAIVFLLGGVALATIYFVGHAWSELRETGGFWRGNFIGTCREAMRYLGYALLLSLQFLIAAEIIHTVLLAAQETKGDAFPKQIAFQMAQLLITIGLRALLGIILRHEIAEEEKGQRSEGGDRTPRS